MDNLVASCGYRIDSVNEEGAMPHTHTYSSEIIQTFDDNGSILINGTLYKMQKNGLYFIHGLATHFVMPDDINRYSHSILVFNTPLLENLTRSCSAYEAYRKVFTETGGTFCSLSPEDVLKVDGIFLKIKRIREENGPLCEARLFGLLTELLEIGLVHQTLDVTDDTKFADILSYISANALNKISIDDICVYAHVSKYHLCRVFKEKMGVTIGNFIKSRRLSVAKQLLADTDYSITEIAHKCAFTDNSFFTKTFTSEFGITPTAFRAKYR